MKLITDLHVHSHYSRATSRDLTLAGLARGAVTKGINLIATGDMLHPKWTAEMKEQLVGDGSGFYTLHKEAVLAESAGTGGADHLIPAMLQVRFVVAGEVACIYTKGGKVRRQHVLFVLPSIESAEKVQAVLEQAGRNIRSDGRPIIGMDVKDLLALFLKIEPATICIPAHIWTPWFSLFGSKSGFDSIQECFEELSDHIWAVETGLSSDPAMNWRLSELNTRTILSHSDAHSCEKLGREASIFDLPEPTFPALTQALKQKKNLLYTIEFFPEEGKYHADGHRACNAMLTPAESKKFNNLCPTCKLPLVIGVMNRVEELADQAASVGQAVHQPFKHIIPLPEIVGEALGVAPGAKRARTAYAELIKAGGNEFAILLDVPLSDLHSMTTPEIAEGIKRVREGKVTVIPGYDGVYGTIQIFTPAERQGKQAQAKLF
ncbi:MAG: endonuclease Q family protein [Patescibacteria group bacterium]